MIVLKKRRKLMNDCFDISNLHPAYNSLYRSDKRYDLITGGRGSLKTTQVSNFLIRAIRQDGVNAVVSRFTQTSIKNSIKSDIEEAIKRNNVEHLYDIKQYSIVFKPNKSAIEFVGLKSGSSDQSAKLKGLNRFNILVIDEAEELMDKQLFEDMCTSIRTKEFYNKIIVIMNPSFKTHFIYQKFIAPDFYTKKFLGGNVPISKHPLVNHIHGTYFLAKSKEWLSESALLEIAYDKKHDYNRYLYKYGGLWHDRPEGCVIENWSRQDEFPDIPFMYGMDFGHAHDPSAITKVAIRGDKLYVQEIMYQHRMNTEPMARFMLENLDLNVSIISDNAESRLIEELEGYGLPVVRCTKWKRSESVAKLRQYEVVVCGYAPNLVREIENYVFHNRKINEPCDGNDDLIDSMRYVMHEKVVEKDAIF